MKVVSDGAPSVHTMLWVGEGVRMAERSKALRSGRSPLLWAWVRIPLLTSCFGHEFAEATIEL